MDEFILRALIGAVILAITLGPLGAFAVWRHMAYFGDTIAHSALLGVALSLMTEEQIPMPLGMFLVAMAVALILARFTRDARLHADTMLGILAHGTLAVGVLLVALFGNAKISIDAYLFGDVLGISWDEVYMLGGLAVVVLFLVYRCWRPLLMVTLEPNIAAVEGVDVPRVNLLLTVLLAAVISLAIKLTGVLLITAMLIIPAAAARYLSKTPQQMAILASLLGAVSVSAGLFASVDFDAPTGPMMVVSAVVVFLLCRLLHRGA